MKRASRMKYQVNKASYNLLLLFLIINLVYTITSLEILKANNFIGIDVFINIALSLLGFLAAAKVKIYDRNWSYVAVFFGVFQLVRMSWTPQLNLEWTIYLILSSVAAFLAAYISFSKIHLLNKVSKTNYEEREELVEQVKRLVSNNSSKTVTQIAEDAINNIRNSNVSRTALIDVYTKSKNDIEEVILKERYSKKVNRLITENSIDSVKNIVKEVSDTILNTKYSKKELEHIIALTKRLINTELNNFEKNIDLTQEKISIQQLIKAEIDSLKSSENNGIDNNKKLTLKRVNKIYPNGVHAVHNFNLEIEDKDFVVLVGPSGCGKSTTLRMIAGLEGITSGDMFLYDKRINNLAPHDRDIAMIFQDYALYGHMSVYENMGFSLKLRRENKISIHDSVMKVSEIVQLEKELTRLPKNLSGGQRQRVALGRSIVRDAEIFLMDEPLSNLDAKLRASTRKEIVKIHHDLGATIVYVTHDQIEAMTMATKIVVMDMGYIQQVGTPIEVYDKPNNMFVAGFIGMPPMNFITGNVKDGSFISPDFTFKLSSAQLKRIDKYIDREITIGVRPEHFTMDLQHLNKDNWEFDVTVESIEYHGSSQIVRYYIGNKLYNASLQTRDEIKVGDTIKLAILKNKVHFFDTNSTLRISEDLQSLNFYYNGKELKINNQILDIENLNLKNQLKGYENKEVSLSFSTEDVIINSDSNLVLELTDFIPYGDITQVKFNAGGVTIEGRINTDELLEIGNFYPVTFNFNNTNFNVLTTDVVIEGEIK